MIMKKLLILKTGNSLVKSIIWSLIILLSGILPGNKIGRVALLEIKYMDKFLHFLMYFVFSLILYYDLRKYINALKSKYYGFFYIFFISFIWGIIIELIQYYLLSSRQGSVADVMANAGGIFAGILLILITGKYLLQN